MGRFLHEVIEAIEFSNTASTTQEKLGCQRRRARRIFKSHETP